MSLGTSDHDSRGEAAPAPAELGQDQKLRVWDFPTRLFHWCVVSLVVVAWLIVGDEGWMLTVHTVAGYLLLVAIVFRLGWGVIGSTHARFADFVRPWSMVIEYTRQLARRAPPSYIGHNPLGGWSVVVLLVALATIVTTGLIAGDRGGCRGRTDRRSVACASRFPYRQKRGRENLRSCSARQGRQQSG